ncbi:TonB-dependent receptor plug domain-containing protein [Sphingomonas glaciei]|uniref:TonB-dependent receptor n=1 Tax=Sphingomonas glaciei TaxID=2938948 RepID=A0ABY5MYQ1_9SPHN|nr:TonB-dependent receptor [Sphingomonas glaciei]UUR08921.1 TonB-dependent receptor [Sphingomonas glaciei]
MTPPESVEELAKLSIEELAQVEVTSVSKRAEPLASAPAALFVITQEEIRRSSATSLPEVLRNAPNLDVQRINARQYAISARGFNGYETANKLLAHIDGRSIYSTLAAQVFWELHNPILDDLQQIEVVSGPGGTLYGPNAVNGVINITSKSALDTIGGLARGHIGATDRNAGLRYGVALGNDGAGRIYANYFRRNGLPGGPAIDADDDYSGIQAGFRADFDAGRDRFTVQGDFFDTDTDLVKGDGEKGRNVLLRWGRTLSAESGFHVQAYYDQFQRDYLLVRDRLETFDVEAQFNAKVRNHTIIAGAGVRTTKDLFLNNLNPFRLTPNSERLWIVNGFLQDTWAIGPTLDLIAGVKLERSSFSGIEVLPNARIAWRPSKADFWWASISRAVRAPTRIDRDLNFLPLLATADDFKPEKLWAVEAGYRGQPTTRTQVSISLFFNHYDDLRTTELTAGALPIRLSNGLKGNSWGIEAWATHQLLPSWRLQFGIATLRKEFKFKENRVDLAKGESLGNDPQYRLMARSQIDLSPNVELDFGTRFVDGLKRPAVKGYVDADARLGWRITDQVELFVAGANLLHESRAESAYKNGGQLVERSVVAGTRVRF